MHCNVDIIFIDDLQQRADLIDGFNGSFHIVCHRENACQEVVLINLLTLTDIDCQFNAGNGGDGLNAFDLLDGAAPHQLDRMKLQA